MQLTLMQHSFTQQQFGVTVKHAHDGGEFVTPIKARDELISDTKELESILDTGAQPAREVSEKTIAVVYEWLGFLQIR